MTNRQTDEKDSPEQPEGDGKMFDWRTVLQLVAIIAAAVAAGLILG